MITYNVLDIKSNPDNGGVFFVYWMATLNDGSVNPTTNDIILTKQTGSCNFTPDENSPSYIQFQSLTEEQVLAWVKEVIDIDAVEQEMVQRHERTKAETQTVFPWMANNPIETN